MKKATIILLCFTVIWSYYKTAINGTSTNSCLMCKEAKTLFCRNKLMNSLESIRTENVSNIERLVADENQITLSKNDTEILNITTSLRFLDLRKNNIGPVLNNTIKHDKLEELDLDGNQINVIPTKFFSEIPNMEVLILSNNSISEIPVDLLDSNTNIKALVLSNNKGISTIPDDLFKDNNTLEALLVDGTSLEHVPFGILNKLQNLKALNVRNNEKMIKPLDPKIFYEHDELRFLFTSGYADCCNIKRMKERFPNLDTSKKKWYCSFKNTYGWKESCAIRIRSGKVDDTFMGHVEVNVDKSEIWKKIFRNWTMNDAKVVCKEAGYGKALEYINMTDYSRRKSLNDTIFPADDANVKRYELKGNCNGSEFSILRCGAGELAKEHTGITADAGVGVRCQIPVTEANLAMGLYFLHVKKLAFAGNYSLQN